MRSLLRFLVSRTVAIALMAAMAFVLALATLVPAGGLAPERLAELRRSRPVAAFLVERLRPEETARSPVFLGLAGLVFVSTAWSIVERVRGEMWRRSHRGAGAVERFRARRALETDAGAEAALAAVRTAVGRDARGIPARDAGNGEVAVTVARGLAGFAGSIAFHLGILLAMVAVGVSALTRFNAEVLLVEGVPQPVGLGAVVNPTRPEMLRDLAGVSLRVRDFHAQYERGYAHVDFGAIFEIRGGRAGDRDEVVRVNQPVDVNGFQFTLYRYGFAPEIAVRRAGKALAEGLAILRVIPPGVEDGLALEDGSELRLALYPDHARDRGKDVSRTMTPIAPLMTVRHLVGGREVAAGAVRRGESGPVGELAVAFPGLRYWVDFQVGRDAGLPWFAAGACLVAVGLGARFLFDPRTLRVSVKPARQGSRIEVLSTARYFPALNEDRADRLARAIAARLGGRSEGKAA